MLKYSRIPNYTFQLVDCDFELMNADNKMSSDSAVPTKQFINGPQQQPIFEVSINDLRMKNNKNAENQAIIEIGIDSKLLEYDCDLILYSNRMQKCIYEKLSQNTIPIYLYAILDNQLSHQVGDCSRNL